MLNPFANDFDPTALSKKEQPQTTKKKQDHKKRSQQTLPPVKKRVDVKVDPVEDTHKHNSKKKNSQQAGKAPLRTGASKTRNRRTSSQADVPPSEPPVTDQFTKEVQFIAIEAAIDPIHRIDNPSSNLNLNKRRTSVTTEQKFEHGYERYIDWIDRSLRKYDTVTLVGMDKAIVDIVSLVAILNDRKIGAHDDIETFTMNPVQSRATSCIQVKLHPYF